GLDGELVVVLRDAHGLVIRQPAHLAIGDGNGVERVDERRLPAAASVDGVLRPRVVRRFGIGDVTFGQFQQPGDGRRVGVDLAGVFQVIALGSYVVCRYHSVTYESISMK